MRNPLISTTLSIVFCFALFHQNIYGASITNLLFETINNEKVSIKCCSTRAFNHLEIPDNIDNIPITSISDYSFSGCTELTSIKLPDSITSIGENAFKNCWSLPTDDIGIQYEGYEKVVAIGCVSSLIGDVRLPNTVKFIHTSAFSGCSGLTSLYIPDNLISIGKHAFDGCTSLPTDKDGIIYESKEKKAIVGVTDKFKNQDREKFEIPETVKYVCPMAFSGLKDVAIIIKHELKFVGEDAFGDCTVIDKTK